MEEKILTKGVFGGKNTMIFLWALCATCFLIFTKWAISWEDVSIVLAGLMSTALLVGITLIIGHILKKRELIVTNKRVIARGAFGFRRDIPIKKIAGISMFVFNGISIGSNSTKIKFQFCKNKIEVFDTIAAETLERDKTYLE